MTRILIAEDEFQIASFLEKGLAANGFSTSIAVDGVTAAAAARDEDFDLLATGIYLYKVRVEVERADGETQVSERIERLAVIR